MRKTILLYGIVTAVLLALLKFIEYRFLIHDLPIEFYLGIIAVFFASLGIWAGRRLTRVRVVVATPGFSVDGAALEKVGISSREYEVLGLIAQGLSNEEIAGKLFVSTSTVKTHTSNLFQKLNARRRTQALQRAKELRLLP